MHFSVRLGSTAQAPSSWHQCASQSVSHLRLPNSNPVKTEFGISFITVILFILIAELTGFYNRAFR